MLDITSVLKPTVVIQANMKDTFCIKFSPSAALDESAFFALLSHCSLFLSLPELFSLSLLLWVVRSKDTLHTFIHKSQLDEGLQKYELNSRLPSSNSALDVFLSVIASGFVFVMEALRGTRWIFFH